jgi:hypothetical protein
METITKDIRPMDAALALALSALGVWIMLENIHGAETDLRVDSTSWAMIPVFLVATVAVLWRRTSPLAVTLVAAAAMAAHVAAFGWLVRCGVGLPLAFVLAYAAGRFVTDRRQSTFTMALTMGVQVLVLVKDSAAGLDVLPFTVVIGAAFWGVGLYVRSRSERRPTPVRDAVTVAS